MVSPYSNNFLGETPQKPTYPVLRRNNPAEDGKNPVLTIIKSFRTGLSGKDVRHFFDLLIVDDAQSGIFEQLYEFLDFRLAGFGQGRAHEGV